METARAELRRRRLLTFLRGDQPAWNEKDHPELAEGAEAWVKRVRSEGEKRIPKARLPLKESEMILLLDTTVLVDVLRARQDRRSLLAELVIGGHVLATTAIDLSEVYAGVRRGEETRSEAFLSSLECYPMTCAISRRAGSLKRAWADPGKTLSLADMIVAATALKHGLSLVTDNHKDFPLPEVNLYPSP